QSLARLATPLVTFSSNRNARAFWLGRFFLVGSQQWFIGRSCGATNYFFLAAFFLPAFFAAGFFLAAFFLATVDSSKLIPGELAVGAGLGSADSTCRSPNTRGA